MASPVLMACGTPQTLPHRVPVAALLVAVLDVVVDEREIVHQLDGRRPRQRLAIVAGDGLAGQQAHGGAQLLALPLNSQGRRRSSIHPRWYIIMSWSLPVFLRLSMMRFISPLVYVE